MSLDQNEKTTNLVITKGKTVMKNNRDFFRMGCMLAALTVGVMATGANAAMIDNGGITASASSQFNANYTAEKTLNGYTGIGYNQHWASAGGSAAADQWIAWDLGASYVLDAIHVWNHNQAQGTDATNRSIQQLDIYVSNLETPGNDPSGVNAANWTLFAENVTFSQASGTTGYAGFDLETEISTALPATAVRWVYFDVDTNYGGALTGLTEIAFSEVEPAVVVPTPAALPAGLGLIGLLAMRRRRG